MEFSPRALRRKDRAMDEKSALGLLAKGEYCVLATADSSGLPLATPLSYVLLDGSLYFHCAMQGHKLDNIAARPQVCLSVVGRTQPMYTGDFTTKYESVTAQGHAALVADDAEKRRALLALCEKYLPDEMDKAEEGIARSLGITAVVRVALDSITGKSNWGG